MNISLSDRALSTPSIHTLIHISRYQALCLTLACLVYTSITHAQAQPRSRSENAKSPALSGLPLPDQGPMLSPEAARVWAAEQAQWDLERSAMRTRIAQLLAENRSLRLQLGQMHAASFGTPPPPPSQQSR